MKTGQMFLDFGDWKQRLDSIDSTKILMLTTRQAADILGVSQSNIYHPIERGYFEAFKIRFDYRINSKSFLEYIERIHAS